MGLYLTTKAGHGCGAAGIRGGIDAAIAQAQLNVAREVGLAVGQVAAHTKGGGCPVRGDHVLNLTECAVRGDNRATQIAQNGATHGGQRGGQPVSAAQRNAAVGPQSSREGPTQRAGVAAGLAAALVDLCTKITQIDKVAFGTYLNPLISEEGGHLLYR